ncbi:hypothetical protein D4L85_10425 [Chryseolinea soli]|uniref:Uncharacterized protein n=1 Tax=Chryseolinea soli TaxID=2321403 RepID=A0A385SPS9_9BACT|nr:hypothetical protein D4L85_10425 [Chryseolinea soli]
MPGLSAIAMPGQNTLFYDKAGVKNYMLKITDLTQHHAMRTVDQRSNRKVNGRSKSVLLCAVVKFCQINLGSGVAKEVYQSLVTFLHA